MKTCSPDDDLLAGIALFGEPDEVLGHLPIAEVGLLGVDDTPGLEEPVALLLHLEAQGERTEEGHVRSGMRCGALGGVNKGNEVSERRAILLALLGATLTLVFVELTRRSGDGAEARRARKRRVRLEEESL